MCSIFILVDQHQVQDLSVVKEKIGNKFPAVVPQSWNLNIRVFRGTENKSPPDTQSILRLSHYSDEAFFAIDSGENTSVISVSSERAEPFVKLLADKFNTLWTSRSVFVITSAVSYEVDDIKLRLGELRIPGPSQVIRGVLCSMEVSSSVPQEKTAKLMIADTVETLGFAQAKHYFGTWPVGNKSEEARLWCDAINQRS
jgi:hypothetical protein